ncbi:alkylhydroperoxidase family enzyme [Bradyrhizobium sp. AZCC 1588]
MDRFFDAELKPAEGFVRRAHRQAESRGGLAPLTLLSDGVNDEIYAQASAEFSEKELAYLTSAVASINVWNRFGAAFRRTPPARKNAAA